MPIPNASLKAFVVLTSLVSPSRSYASRASQRDAWLLRTPASREGGWLRWSRLARPRSARPRSRHHVETRVCRRCARRAPRWSTICREVVMSGEVGGGASRQRTQHHQAIALQTHQILQVPTASIFLPRKLRTLLRCEAYTHSEPEMIRTYMHA